MNWLALRTKITAILAKFGAPATVSRGATAIGTFKGIFVSSKTENSTASPSALLAQTSVGSKTLVISADTGEILVGDTVLFDSITYTIQAVDAVRPTNTTLLFKCEVQ